MYIHIEHIKCYNIATRWECIYIPSQWFTSQSVVMILWLPQCKTQNIQLQCLQNENAWALMPSSTSCPLCQCFCQKMSWCEVTMPWLDVAWRDVTLWHHDMASDDVMTEPIRNFGNHIFRPGDLDLWPMTLTFELIRQILGLYVKRFSQTDRHTHTETGPIPYPWPLMREGITCQMSIQEYSIT